MDDKYGLFFLAGVRSGLSRTLDGIKSLSGKNNGITVDEIIFIIMTTLSLIERDIEKAGGSEILKKLKEIDNEENRNN